MYACIHTPAFAVQAALRFQPQLRRTPVAILDGEPPLERVLTTNDHARRLGVAKGMSRLQAESFSGVRLLSRSTTQEKSAQHALLSTASFYSPRIQNIELEHGSEPCGTLVLDIAGTKNLFGDAHSLASSLRSKAATCGLQSNVAVSTNLLASACAARGLKGIHVLPPTEEAFILGPLPIQVLDPSPQIAETLHTWGIRTCAQLARLSETDLITRLGIEGHRLRSLARGELKHLLVPIEPSLDSELVETVTLDYPVELLEPLLFLFARMVDQLILRVQVHSLAIESLLITLIHPTDAQGSISSFRRTVRPALPSQDARRLLKLIQLDLETHPPSAPILAIEVSATSARPQTAQHGIFLPQSPEPGRLDILMARLRKLFGDDRVGTPQLLDTHHSDGFRITAFDPFHATFERAKPEHTAYAWPTVFRVSRPPRAIHVGITTNNMPSTVTLDDEHYAVETYAGPWRRNGEWWSHSNWCREEWDVVLTHERSKHDIARICRIAHDPGSECWYLEGTYD